eukprot:jgi/Mesvir1/12013/Mv00314-RA.1
MLSKKELKKKEMEDLNAVLAELGMAKVTENGDGAHDDDKEGKEDAGDAPVGPETEEERRKRAEKRKAKKKAKAEGGAEPPAAAPEPEPEPEPQLEVPIDAANLKKVLAKKGSKPADKSKEALTKIAAAEAAARAKKLSAAKKKDKSNYNQHPSR